MSRANYPNTFRGLPSRQKARLSSCLVDSGLGVGIRQPKDYTSQSSAVPYKSDNSHGTDGESRCTRKEHYSRYTAYQSRVPTQGVSRSVSLVDIGGQLKARQRRDGTHLPKGSLGRRVSATQPQSGS